ncbi:MAG: CotH kinase family protein [Chitinophagales bacterium]
MNKFLAIVLFSFFSLQTSAQIYINEWMSSNSSTIADPDFDETGDWVELFNDFNQPVNLSGYFLTDNFGDKSKWQFPPNTQIEANSFLLVWTDGEDTGLHTNFKLTKDGEQIGLYNTDTLTLDSIIYSVQKTDISMGRRTDGSPNLSFFLTPTPGSSNSTESFEGLTFYEPHFSLRGGFYDAPIEVDLTALGGTIHYTLDGSLPTLNSPQYTAPLQIAATTNLRARVFQANFIGGKPITHTYFFNENFEERDLPVVSISTNPEYFWDAEIGLYVQDFKPEWEYPINIELFENDGGNRAVINELAGTKVNGLNSWELPQKMLGIYFDNEYDKNNIDYPLFFDRNRNQYDTFILRAGGSDWSQTIFRDGLSQGLTSENMDLEKAGFRPSVVYVNGEYLGIANLRSRINESFIEDNFGYGSGEYDLIENNGIVEEGDATAFNELFALFNKDLSQEANFQAVGEVMDIQNFTDYFITQIWASNSSWGHNIKLWKPKKSGSKWRWILQDFDRGFSGADNNGVDYFTSDNSPAYYDWARVPLENMLQNESYKDEFTSRFADHLYTTFHPNQVKKAIAERKSAIEKEMPNHVQRWAGTTSGYGDGIVSVDFWENEVQNLVDFAEEREAWLIDDLQTRFSLEDGVSLGMMTFPTDAGHIEINNIPIPDSPWSGLYFKDLEFELQAVAKAGHEFEGWSKADSETLIEKGAEWKYLDDGSNQGTTWQALDFNDDNWESGLAQLGYGDGDENTELSYGNNEDNKHPTTYFRKTFVIENLENYTGALAINLLRDDGAVVYLNGQELFRSNMPTEDVGFDTYAAGFIGNPEENSFYSFLLQTDELLEGENIIAVEVHQANAISSDLSFDFELKTLKSQQTDVFSTEELLSVNLSDDDFYIANFSRTNECVLPRTIAQNTTLTTDCSPYLAVDDVVVLEGVILEIEAGVEVHFAENVRLMVNGQLEVLGTETSPVHFKAMQGVEKWGNVNFQFSSETSHLNWLEIEDASKGKHPIHEKAAISAFYGSVDMNHLKIVDVFNDPIFAQYSNISLKNSQLHSRVTGDLINVKYGQGFVENCDFRGNNQVDTDAIDYDEVENGIIRGSKIYNFLGFNSDGIDLGEESSNVLIENNFIHNCTDKAISVGQLSSVLVRNNTIVNCAQGLGIKDNSTAEIDQNTFYNTTLPVACFEKNIGLGGGMAFVSNSIFSNAADLPYIEGAESIVQISNSLSDTEVLEGMNNVLGNPHFTNPTLQDFSLLPTSLAIGAGVNDSGNTIDLGTKSHNYSGAPSILISTIHYHPMEDADAEFIQLYNPSTATVDLTGYVLSNAVDLVFPALQIAPDETIWLVKDASLFSEVTGQVVEWTSGKLSNGGETIRLTDAHEIIVDQVTYDDALPWVLEADGQGAWLSLISSDLDNHFAENWKAGTVLTDIENLDNERMSIRAFPNPAKDYLKIQSSHLLVERVELFNVLGQKLLDLDFEGAYEVELDLRGLPLGVGILKVNGMVLKEKVLLGE